MVARTKAKKPDHYKNLTKAYYLRNGEKAKCRSRLWREENLDRETARKRRYYAVNKREIIAKTNEYKLANIDRVRERDKAWRKRNLDRHRKNQRASQRRVFLRDPGKVRARKCHSEAVRKAAKIRAMPKWVNRGELRVIYDEAASRRAETGADWHVDHIVPLRNSTVCGLHVPWNLQIIPASENIRKSNRLA